MSWLPALREAAAVHMDGFDWGENDCCQFANTYYEKVTGKDLAADFDYSTQYGANRVLAEAGGLSGLLNNLLGESHKVPDVGDIVLVSMSDDGELMAAGVFNGYCAWTIHPDQGLVRVPENRIMESWSCR